jgi:hypothetical protein
MPGISQTYAIFLLVAYNWLTYGLYMAYIWLMSQFYKNITGLFEKISSYF